MIDLYDNIPATSFKVGIYARLSKEDSRSKLESESISNQKKMLENYVAMQGWVIIDTYIDDGYSGLNFSRPAFQRLIADIEAKKVNMVITKDLSRLRKGLRPDRLLFRQLFPCKGNPIYCPK